MDTAASAVPFRGYAFPRAVPPASVVAFRAPAVPRLRQLCLGRWSVVRIADGPGTLVHVHEGIVWITEERSRRDVFLAVGQTHRVANEGLTIVHADRDSRIALEFARGRGPGSVEIAPAGGGPGRTVSLPTPGERTIFATLLDAARRLRGAFDAWWNAPREAPLRDAWPRSGVPWRDDDFTPEAVRARVMRSSPFPYY